MPFQFILSVIRFSLIAFLIPVSAWGASSPDASHARLTDVARAAYHYSPAIKAARQALRGTEELYPQALANYQPLIGFSAGITDEKLDNSNFAGAAGQPPRMQASHWISRFTAAGEAGRKRTRPKRE